MKYIKVLFFMVSVLLVGCASTTSQNTLTQEELQRLENGEVIVVQYRQSHGLIGDLMHDVLPHPN